MTLSTQAEKRVRRIVYSGEQLIEKRGKLHQKRYERACSEAETLDELDEAIRRLDVKFPRLKLSEILKDSS